MKVKTCDCGCKNKKILAKGGCTPKKRKIKKNYNGGLMLEDSSFLDMIVEKFYNGGKSSVKKFETPAGELDYKVKDKDKEKFKKAELEGKYAKVRFENTEMPLDSLIGDRIGLYPHNKPVYVVREPNYYDKENDAHTYTYLTEFNRGTTDYGATYIPQIEETITVPNDPNMRRDTSYIVHYYTPNGTISTRPVSTSSEDSIAARKFSNFLEPIKRKIRQ
jgi:hypothetical protein